MAKPAPQPPPCAAPTPTTRRPPPTTDHPPTLHSCSSLVQLTQPHRCSKPHQRPPANDLLSRVPRNASRRRRGSRRASTAG
ncbi:hypothetical protein OAO87_01615 [bacterium]|nr:hypothetical protein [bacterium]